MLHDQKDIITRADLIQHQEILGTIKAFYCDDDDLKQMPGKKDYVSLGKKQQMSKRFILCNLKELYAAYKFKYPDHKVGFLKFCSLQPKWCVLAGTKGTHSVYAQYTKMSS